MTKRQVIPPSPRPLEAYVEHFDHLLGKRNQREGFRRYLEGLLLPAERNKTLTGLANTEPVMGAQEPRAHALQWFLSESDWNERAIQQCRLDLLLQEPSTAPNARGVLVIDEHGDRKDGHKTAHVGRQYLSNLGKIDNGVVSVSSLWADEQVYYPLDVEPYTPAHHFVKGKQDPAFRTKLKLAGALVQQAVEMNIPFRAVVADSFYGEDRGFKGTLKELGVGYVLALKPSHEWWHPEHESGSFEEAAHQAGWESAECPGRWVKVVRTFRDGSSQDWWALEVITGPYGPSRAERVIISTTDPITLPKASTFYLVTHLAVPDSQRAAESPLEAADLAEVVRLYGRRMWVEQSYKQVKYALGWSQYQVRSDRAIRRHWQLVCCAFSFCWYHDAHPSEAEDENLAGQRDAFEPRQQEYQPVEQAVGGKKGARSKLLGKKRSTKQETDRASVGPKLCAL